MDSPPAFDPTAHGASQDLGTRPVLTLSTPADVVEAIPFLLGFTPATSLVLIGLAGPRRRVRLSVRVDLPGERHDTALADLLGHHLEENGAERALLAVYTEAPAAGAALPRLRLVETIRAVLGERGIRLADALLVSAGRWWSYHCSDAGCCPPEGRALRPAIDGASPVAATAAYAGLAALPSQEPLEESLRAPDGPAGVGAGEAADRVRQQLRSRQAAGISASALRAEARALLRDVLERYDGGRPRLEAAEAARLVLALHDVSLRDEVIGRATGRSADALRSLLTDLLRRAVPPEDAPVATVLAAVAYAQGNGAVAAIALDRALASDPHYGLARLLSDAVKRGVHPRVVRRAFRLDGPATRHARARRRGLGPRGREGRGLASGR